MSVDISISSILTLSLMNVESLDIAISANGYSSGTAIHTCSRNLWLSSEVSGLVSG
jgi:hypothetical protein